MTPDEEGREAARRLREDGYALTDAQAERVVALLSAGRRP